MKRFHILQLQPQLQFLATIVGQSEARQFIRDWTMAHTTEKYLLVLVDGETFEPIMTSGVL